MGLKATLETVAKSITPIGRRQGRGAFIQCAPNGASKQLPGHATPAINKWGNLTELLSATANTTECWIEGIVVSQATAAAEFFVGLSIEPGAAAPTVAEFQAVLAGYQGAAPLTSSYLPVRPPVHIPANTHIAAALAGTKKVDCWVIISRNKRAV